MKNTQKTGRGAQTGELQVALGDPKYRAISWWVTWKDLAWPDQDVADDFRRRADAAAANSVNCAIIFGTHLRWDFLPLWENLHDMFAFLAAELHSRGIRLFDHHSSVLTHRYANQEQARAMRTFNRHHVPFAPSREAVSEWRYQGQRLNDWRMIDVVTGGPTFLPRYTAEQFCMNNPNFQTAYYSYVRRLLEQTGIDGLMSDDGIFYSGWTSCGCQYCRERFQTSYGRALPPSDDSTFWGNFANDAFKDWVAMRYAITREYLEGVRAVTGPTFSLMTCCANSLSEGLPAHAMTYQEFKTSCNHVMLEMCGDTPNTNGTWNEYFPEQMLHLGISREIAAPCFGLGYGFRKTTADFIWAFNKFLGSSTWFSTLKGRLGLPDSKMTQLPDDTELCGTGFSWEHHHQHLFNLPPAAPTALFFSRWTRDYCGRSAARYVAQFRDCCQQLLDQNSTFNVVTTIPKVTEYPLLAIPAAWCLSLSERQALCDYLGAGGTLVATGAIGALDDRARVVQTPWLEQFGIDCPEEFDLQIECFAAEKPPTTSRPVTASHSTTTTEPVTASRPVTTSEEWVSVQHQGGALLWSPDGCIADRVAKWLRSRSLPPFDFINADGWRFRVFENDHAVVVHGLAAQLEVGVMADLEAERQGGFGNNHLIDTLVRSKTVNHRFTVALSQQFTAATLHVPLRGYSAALPMTSTEVLVDIAEDAYYCILEFNKNRNDSR